MITFKRLLIALVLPFALAACEGAGVKDQSQIVSTVQTASPDSIFIFRDTGFQGSATLMTAYLNGVEVGKIGVNESLEIKAPRGTHQVMVKAGSIDAALIDPGIATVVKNGTKPHFFIVTVTAKFMTADVNLTETTPQSYLSAVQ